MNDLYELNGKLASEEKYMFVVTGLTKEQRDAKRAEEKRVYNMWTSKVKRIPEKISAWFFYTGRRFRSYWEYEWPGFSVGMVARWLYVITATVLSALWIMDRLK